MAKAIRQEWKCFIGALIPRGGRGCCFEFRHKGTGEGRAQFVRVVRTWSPEARALSGDLGLGTAFPVPGCVRLGKEFNLVDPEFLLL